MRRSSKRVWNRKEPAVNWRQTILLLVAATLKSTSNAAAIEYKTCHRGKWQLPSPSVTEPQGVASAHRPEGWRQRGESAPAAPNRSRQRHPSAQNLGRPGPQHHWIYDCARTAQGAPISGAKGSFSTDHQARERPIRFAIWPRNLPADPEVLLILTTNRPEQIEPALVSRPGRIDQALEVPLPDEEGRAKLTRNCTREGCRFLKNYWNWLSGEPRCQCSVY